VYDSGIGWVVGWRRRIGVHAAIGRYAEVEITTNRQYDEMIDM